MSRHEGVSCDSCLKGNFRGKRYKCLICYDYDLCATCYESGATTTRHTTDHPMQCILTRTDIELYYGGESPSAEQPQSFTCPYCGKMGYTETTLQDHVTTEHADSSTEVVCPVCAAHPGGDPNHVTDDFAAHLTLEHRAPRDFDEPIGRISHVRRIPHTQRGVSSGGTRARRTNMHFQPSAAGGTAGTGLSALSPAGGSSGAGARDNMDPIAGELVHVLSHLGWGGAASAPNRLNTRKELLSQLSSVRSRAAAAQNVSSQLQQLEMQLQSTRQQLERLPRRPATENRASANSSAPQVATTTMEFPGASGAAAAGSKFSADSQFLLARCGDSDLSEHERQAAEIDRADRSMFVQELLLSTLAEGLRLDDSDSLSNSSDSESEINSLGSLGLENEGRNSPREPSKPLTNRNMVKHLENTRNMDKEPPPVKHH